MQLILDQKEISCLLLHMNIMLKSVKKAFKRN